MSTGPENMADMFADDLVKMVLRRLQVRLVAHSVNSSTVRITACIADPVSGDVGSFSTDSTVVLCLEPPLAPPVLTVRGP